MVGGDKGFRTGAEASGGVEVFGDDEVFNDDETDGNGELLGRGEVLDGDKVLGRHQSFRTTARTAVGWRSSQKTKRVFAVIMGRRTTGLVGGMRQVLSPHLFNRAGAGIEAPRAGTAKG